MATETLTAAPARDRRAQVRVHLTTKSEELQLPDSGPILMSTDVRRYQLSTLVNRLLDTTSPIPLEFLINGHFLRTSLDDFLTNNGISAETTLSVEYVKALVPPLFVASYEHDDWVSSVHVLSPSSKAAQWAGDRLDGTVPSRILSGSYDGLLRVWNMSSEVVATGQGHSGAVKAAAFLSPTHVVSSGIDRTIRLWKYEDAAAGTAALTPSLELYGHKSSIDALAVHAPSSRILSASADHTLGLWSTKKTDAPAAPSDLLPTSTSAKRRKLSNPTNPAPQRGPLSLLHGHSSPVSATAFDARDASVAYSASWDHSVKTWDLPTSTCVDTRTTPHSLFALCHLPAAGLLAAGTAARTVTLLDPRASAAAISAMTLRGHANAVVSLAPDPGSTYQLASGSHDGTCRVWDLRSVRQEGGGAERLGASVYVIERESAKETPRSGVAGEGSKVFGVVWDAEVGIVSAGEDKRVQINKGS